MMGSKADRRQLSCWRIISFCANEIEILVKGTSLMEVKGEQAALYLGRVLTAA
jgi:hypothetical protein